jgi:membrane-associated protein
MEFLAYCLDYLIHLDKHLNELVQSYGNLTYLILGLIVFCETGLVITPFLPGDSLLFIIGTISSGGALNVFTITIILIVSAVTGDNVNYFIGKYIGPKIFKKENVRLLNKNHLIKTQNFYEKHGGKTIIIARFMPIIRTFAPFVAGIGKMKYIKFLSYSIGGAFLWVLLFVFAGYFFGNLPFVKNNFGLVIMVIILISIMPGVVSYIKNKRHLTKDS